MPINSYTSGAAIVSLSLRMSASVTRMQRELKILQTSPPPGVCAWPVEGALNHLHAQIQGPENTVYAKGIFKLDVRIPER